MRRMVNDARVWPTWRCVHRIFRVNLFAELDLARLAHLGQLYTHKPKMLKVRGTRSTLLLFSTGRGILHTSPRLPEALTPEVIAAAWTPEERRRRRRRRYPSLQIELVSATYACELRSSTSTVDLAAASRAGGARCSYEPELFPGLVCTPPPPPAAIISAQTAAPPRLVANLFHTGKVIIMGAVREEQVDHALAYLRSLIKVKEKTDDGGQYGSQEATAAATAHEECKAASAPTPAPAL